MENYPNTDERNEEPQKGKLSQEDDGRNKEWQDRARVNLEKVKEGTKTSIERDFEPEQEGDGQKPAKPDQSVY